jgi:hypothetical protein
MQRTTAPGSVGGQYVDDNPALGIVGTLVIADDKNATQEEIVGAIEGAGITASGVDVGQLLKAVKRLAIERGKQVGEIFALADRKVPVAWSDPDTYFPAVCLSDIASYADVTTAQVPDLVAILRAIKSGYQVGMAASKTAFDVTNWAIAANVATLTFANTAAEIAFLAALSEDQAAHGSYTGWRTVTLASAIGSITAGDYAITNINAAARTLTFAFTASNGSGAVTATAEFYAHRVSGSTTSARLFGVQGMTLHAANDSNGYFMGALRRRSYMQGHKHAYSMSGATFGRGGVTTGGGSGVMQAAAEFSVENPTTDGTNGTPRTAKDTNGPALSVHLYIHAGRKLS